jgi:hypothetical protein
VIISEPALLDGMMALVVLHQDKWAESLRQGKSMAKWGSDGGKLVLASLGRPMAQISRRRRRVILFLFSE